MINIPKNRQKCNDMKFSYRLRQLILLSGDIGSFAVAFWLSLAVRNFAIPSPGDISEHLPLFLLLFIFWLIINYINGLYDLTTLSNDKKSLYRFAGTALLSLGVGIAFFYLVPKTRISPKTILLLNTFFGYLLSLGWRGLYHNTQHVDRFKTNVLCVGHGEELEELADIISAHPKRGYRIAAYIDPIKKINFKEGDVSTYTNLQKIRPAVTSHDIGLVVISPHLMKNEEALRELYELLFWSIPIVNLPSFYETITGRIPPSTFSESWFLEHIRHSINPMYENLRTLIDYVVGIILGGVFIALCPLIALAIRLNSKGPVFFTQKRVGQHGKIFDVYKFRSMFVLANDGSAETSGAEFATKNDKRVTSVGKFLRKTRLDELPQCINLLKRDTTLIGPRPERPEIVAELQRRVAYYPLRHIVRPGLTSWAVLHQNYADTMEKSLQKLQYDLYYIKNRSILMDLSILLKTISVIIRFKGQ